MKNDHVKFKIINSDIFHFKLSFYNLPASLAVYLFINHKCSLDIISDY